MTRSAFGSLMRAAFRLREAIWAAWPEKNPYQHLVLSLSGHVRTVWKCSIVRVRSGCVPLSRQKSHRPLFAISRNSGTKRKQAEHCMGTHMKLHGTTRRAFPLRSTNCLFLNWCRQNPAPMQVAILSVVAKKESLASPHLASRVHRTLDVCRCAQCDG